MSAERIALFEAVPGWSWDVWRAKHDATLEAVRRWFEREGPHDPTHAHRETGVPVRKWIEHWRRQHDDGELGDGVRLVLEAIPGWSWTPTASAA